MSRLRNSQTGPPVAASHQAALAIKKHQQHRAASSANPSAYGAWLDRTRQAGAHGDTDRHYFSGALERFDVDASSDDDGATSHDSDDPHGYRRVSITEDNLTGRPWQDDDDRPHDDDAQRDGWLVGGRGDQAPLGEAAVRRYDIAKQIDVGDEASTSASITDDADSTASDASLGPETIERLEWQLMLNNVLQGDVLKSEKTRLSSTLAHQLDDSAGMRKYHAQQVWLGVRAYVRARGVEHERRYLEEARSAIDDILNDVLTFRVTEGITESQAAEEVALLLRRVQWAISLYPSIHAFIADKPAFNQENLIARIDAMQSWATVTRRLRVQIGILQRWSGSDELEVTQPVNERVPAERVVSERGAGSAQEQANDPNRRTTADLLDHSTFVERILKDSSIEKTFQKGTLTDVFPLVRTAKYTMISNRDLFSAMRLPPFGNALVALLKFPVRLMQEAVRVQLDLGQRAPKDDPSMVLIDQLTDDFRSCLSIASQLKQSFVALIEPEPEMGWDPPDLQVVVTDFQHVLEEALRFFFKLLHWKLRSAGRSIYLKETEVVESEWHFLNEATEPIEGADILIGEHFSMITHRLIFQVLSYFNDTLESLLKRNAPIADTSRWFNQTLDNVRQRHRKLLRFGMGLIQRFENAAEYRLEDIDLAAFIDALADSGHFLCYTGSSESQGAYIIGNAALHDKREIVQRMLTRTYNIDSSSAGPQNAGFGPSVRDMPETTVLREQTSDPTSVPSEPYYLLIITPREPFLWTGRVMNLAIKTLDYDMRDRRVRIISDGPLGRLVRAKHRLYDLFPIFRSLVTVEALVHIGRVNREVKKIKAAQFRLAQNIVGACDRVHEVARTMEGSDALLAAYYSFAADLGQRSLRTLELKFKSRLVPMLMIFAIRWVNFICEDCIPSDSRTFKWAVQALEFVRFTTRSNNILQLSGEDFAHLRSGVAACMALLISHFDILGARSSTEAKKEKDKIDAARQEARRTLEAKLADMRAAGMATPNAPPTTTKTSSLRLVSERLAGHVGALDERRKEVESEMRLVGRVLDQGKPEDRSLLFLAASSSNISIRWQQGRFIGGGTFGQVYLGVNLDSGELMAVKEIRFQDLASAPSLIKQIRDEMRVMEMLHHPHIVEYYGIEVHRDKVYIFEEYCQGGSLASLLEHGRIEDESVLQLYALQLLDGLVYLHSEHVIHRDIKPDNILLDYQGVIKYVDFGAAKVLNNQKRTMQRSLRGEAVNNSLTGTPSYMSPETIKGQVVGPEGAMDVWSLGCVVLECATGKRPWSELDNEWAIMFQIGIAAKPPPLPDENQLSALGIDFIRHCLVIDANERPTAATLRNEHPWILEFQEQMARDYAEEVSEEIMSMANSSQSTLPLLSPQGSINAEGIREPLQRGLQTLGEEEEEE